MKHRLNSQGQAGTIDDRDKIAESLMSSQPIANAVVVCCHICQTEKVIDYQAAQIVLLL
jgi:hypothetical protein